MRVRQINRLLIAAQNGDMHAQYQLGNKYYIGSGVEQDFVEAERWLKKASFHGHSGAKLLHAIMCGSVTGGL